MNSRPTPTGPTRRQWILLVCLFLLSLPAVTPRIYSSDEIQYFAYLRSLWFDRDLSFENEYQYFYERGVARSEGFHETFLERTTETGRRINFATIGCAILWTPFYVAGHAVARATGAAADGYSKPYLAAVAYGSAVYGFLALVLAILAARRLGFDAFAGAVAIWLGTPLLFYMYVAPPFSHACSAFGVALFVYVWLRVRDTWSTRGLAALAAAAALMAMIREQDAFFAAGPALDLALSAAARLRSNTSSPAPALKGLLAAALVFAAVFVPQAASYIVLNGHLGPHSSVGQKMRWSAPHALQVLFSPAHGFFVWTPLALVAIAGIVLLVLPVRADRKMGSEAASPSTLQRIGICLIVMIAFQVYVGGSVESWTVAGAYGQRRFVATTSLLIIGYAALRASASRVGSARPLLAAVTVVCVYWNLALIAEFATGLMDRQRLEPRRNAYDAAVTLPRMAPALVYRYLFDRASFYRQAETGARGPGR